MYMLTLMRNKIVRSSLIFLLRVSAVSTVVLWVAPSAVAGACEEYPINIQTACGTACGCYYTGGSTNCTPAPECGESCNWGYGC